MHNNNSIIIFYDPPNLLKNIRRFQWWREQCSLATYYFILLLRFSATYQTEFQVNKQVDLTVFLERVKGWTQGQSWCQIIQYCLLIDHGRSYYDLSNCKQDIDIFLFNFKCISPVQHNEMSLYSHQFLHLPRYLMPSGLS